ncbi:MAG: hypothetical protein KJ676_04025 [Alphaproteobacteria bacterium]|nr:hypothetical protein [Alphaproteobacteria bacterium]MBU1524963.1 hypothetical protein [Alphaproteobacteria bacterium]MBU2116895.1 hypothetical protein [Alphaproteobacteria bacterium]MBU2350319.1 hypothetical protein [Alphaproteobacteria bacterium]MBU2381796.1 hypothetical protein [Alphaproteobacteria bacterium]
MTWVVDNIQAILVVCGLLTATMLQFVFMPSRAARSTYGETVDGALGDVVIRGWGLLIALTGGMLVWAAFHPETRTLAIGVALISKIFYMGQLMAKRGRFLRGMAGMTVVLDLIMAALLATWMWAEHGA